MKYLAFFLAVLLVIPAFGQICQDAESDTLLASEALASLRFDLNDYRSSNQTWPDSVLYNFLNQAKWEISAKGVIEKRDTIVTKTDTSFYTANSDFMYEHGVILKDDGRWTALIKPDSVGHGILYKQDTIVTTNNTAMYSLNDDFIFEAGVLWNSSGRWRSLGKKLFIGLPRDSLFGGKSDASVIGSYAIVGKRMFIDSPPIEGGDTLLVIYAAFEYFVSDKQFVISRPVAGDSIIVFYAAYGNELTGAAVIVNMPYEYRTQLIEGAYNRAVRANNH